MKENICRNCKKIFYHKYGQVLCKICLKEIGDGMYKSNIEDHLQAYFERVGCRVKSLDFNIETQEANVVFIPPKTEDYIDLTKLKDI